MRSARYRLRHIRCKLLSCVTVNACLYVCLSVCLPACLPACIICYRRQLNTVWPMRWASLNCHDAHVYYYFLAIVHSSLQGVCSSLPSRLKHYREPSSKAVISPLAYIKDNRWTNADIFQFLFHFCVCVFVYVYLHKRQMNSMFCCCCFWW